MVSVDLEPILGSLVAKGGIHPIHARALQGNMHTRVKLCIDSKLSSGLSRGPRSCEAATLPYAML